MGARPLHGGPLRPLLAALLLAAAGLAGCGEAQIDTARTEDEIAEAISRQTGFTVEEVECPEDVEAEKGGRFECAARGPGGGEAKVQVLQTDDDGNITFTARDLRPLGEPGADSGE